MVTQKRTSRGSVHPMRHALTVDEVFARQSGSAGWSRSAPPPVRRTVDRGAPADCGDFRPATIVLKHPRPGYRPATCGYGQKSNDAVPMLPDFLDQQSPFMGGGSGSARPIQPVLPPPRRPDLGTDWSTGSAGRPARVPRISAVISSSSCLRLPSRPRSRSWPACTARSGRQELRLDHRSAGGRPAPFSAATGSPRLPSVL
jgi:hypothetical protein